MREAEREKSEEGGVDGVKEEAGSKGKVKHIEKSDQLFVVKMMYMQVDEQELQVTKSEL